MKEKNSNLLELYILGPFLLSPLWHWKHETLTYMGTAWHGVRSCWGARAAGAGVRRASRSREAAEAWCCGRHPVHARRTAPHSLGGVGVSWRAGVSPPALVPWSDLGSLEPARSRISWRPWLAGACGKPGAKEPPGAAGASRPRVRRGLVFQEPAGSRTVEAAQVMELGRGWVLGSHLGLWQSAWCCSSWALRSRQQWSRRLASFSFLGQVSLLAHAHGAPGSWSLGEGYWR